MRVLLTGLAGFAGSHLAEYLLSAPAQQDLQTSALREIAGPDAEQIQLFGVIHRHDHRVQHLRDRIQLHRGDLRNALWVSELLEAIRPDCILHLAAWSDVGGSWRQPWTAYELNIHCQLNLLEATHRWAPNCRSLVVTSNEVYGTVQPYDLPIDEKTPFRPNTPYGVSKITQDMMALQYWNSHGLATIRARSFNHIGPGQSDDFAASAFARQIAEIEAGLRAPVVSVGNLETHRDFTDVRDIVRAYWLAVICAEAGQVYNVGTGRSRPVRWLLDTLIDLATVDVDVEIDPTRLRPSDVPNSFCDNSRLCTATGWRPEIDLRQSLQDLLDGWRAIVASQQGDNHETNAARSLPTHSTLEG